MKALEVFFDIPRRPSSYSAFEFDIGCDSFFSPSAHSYCYIRLSYWAAIRSWRLSSTCLPYYISRS